MKEESMTDCEVCGRSHGERRPKCIRCAGTPRVTEKPILFSGPMVRAILDNRKVHIFQPTKGARDE